MVNSEDTFVKLLSSQPHFVMTPVKQFHNPGSKSETVLHLSLLKYLSNPFFLRYLLSYPDHKIPIHLENEAGHPAFFLLASFIDDRLFERLFVELIKARPQLDVNYLSSKTGEQLLDLVCVKCPSMFKVNLLLDFGQDRKEVGLSETVMGLLNRSGERCS